jgi:hypothetical protein
MTYQFIICPDPEEGANLDSGNVFYANTPSQVEQRIRDASLRYPASTICVYGLSEVLKLKSKPTYNRYKVAPNGEIVPV